MSIFDTPDDTTYDIVTIQPCGQSAVQPNILWQSAPIHFRGRQLLTAQITTNERFPGSVLSLISWRVKADGSIMHTGESVPRCLNTTTHRGASVSANSSLIDIIHAEKTVTAIRFRDGDVSKIELASWDVSDTGAISLHTFVDLDNRMPSPYMGSSHESAEMAESKNVSPTSLKILAITDTLFVVAFGTDEQTLRMVSWRLDIHGTPVQLDSFTDPNLHVAQISLTSLNPSRQPREGSRGNQPSVEHQLATAIVDNKGCAHLISWTVSALGKIIQNSRQAIATNTAEQGDIRQVDVIADSQGRVFTSYVSKDGKMALSVWRIDVDKGLIQLHDNLIDDLIDDLRAPIGLCRECLLMGWEGSVISAVRSENGLVQLKSWAADPDGSVKMLAQSQPQFEDSEGILLCRNALDGVASIVTSSRDNQNRYRLVSWSVIS